MGRVWLAHDELLHRDVAIKEIVPPPGFTADERIEMRNRSMREARAIARLNHPNVVRVFDVIRSEDYPWIVMEYVPSRSLQQVLDAEGPVPVQRTAEIGLGVLSALRAAHRLGMLHRDVKPGNVLLGRDGRVVLTDFGLATQPGDSTVTRTGLVLGSPAYIAPERARDGTANPDGDMWSLGATLYAAVEGRSPYARSSAIASLTALATEPPPPPRRAGPLRAVLLGLLRRIPHERMKADEVERHLLRAAGPRSRGGMAFVPAVRPLRGGTSRPTGTPIGQPPKPPTVRGSARAVEGPRPAGAPPAAVPPASGGPLTPRPPIDPRPAGEAPSVDRTRADEARGSAAAATGAGADRAGAAVEGGGGLGAAEVDRAARAGAGADGTQSASRSGDGLGGGLGGAEGDAGSGSADAGADASQGAAAGSGAAPESGAAVRSIDGEAEADVDEDRAEGDGTGGEPAEGPAPAGKAGPKTTKRKGKRDGDQTAPPMPSPPPIPRGPVVPAPRRAADAEPPALAKSPGDSPAGAAASALAGAGGGAGTAAAGNTGIDIETAPTETPQTETPQTEATTGDAASSGGASSGGASSGGASSGGASSGGASSGGASSGAAPGGAAKSTKEDAAARGGPDPLAPPLDATRVDAMRPMLPSQPAGPGTAVPAARAAVAVPRVRPGGKRPDRRRTALIVAAVVVGVLLALLLIPLVRSDNDTRSHGSGPSAPGSAAPSESTAGAGAGTPSKPATTTPAPTPTTGVQIPAGWHTYKGPGGFVVAIPFDYTVRRRGSMVYFDERNGPRLLGIDQTDHPKGDPVKDWQAQEETRRARGDWKAYRRVKIVAVDYFKTAADWEWTYDSNGVRTHVVNRGFVTGQKKAYAIYWSTPESVWYANYATFQTIAQTFRPNSG